MRRRGGKIEDVEVKNKTKVFLRDHRDAWGGGWFFLKLEEEKRVNCVFCEKREREKRLFW